MGSQGLTVRTLTHKHPTLRFSYLSELKVVPMTVPMATPSVAFAPSALGREVPSAAVSPPRAPALVSIVVVHEASHLY